MHRPAGGEEEVGAQRVPGSITRGKYGVSIWVQFLLPKFSYGTLLLWDLEHDDSRPRMQGDIPDTARAQRRGTSGKKRSPSPTPSHLSLLDLVH